MIDGDDTYPLNQIRQIIDPIITGETDMTVGIGIFWENIKKKRKEVSMALGIV